MQVRYETGVTNLVVDDGARGRRGVEALHRNRCGQGEFGDHRRGRLRDEPGDGGRAHTRARQKRRTKHHGVVEPYIWATPTTTASASGWASRPEASTKNMDQMFITAAAYPPEILLTGVIVNKDGKRFVTEDSYHSRTSAFVLEQPDRSPT